MRSAWAHRYNDTPDLQEYSPRALIFLASRSRLLICNWLWLGGKTVLRRNHMWLACRKTLVQVLSHLRAPTVSGNTSKVCVCIFFFFFFLLLYLQHKSTRLSSSSSGARCGVDALTARQESRPTDKHWTHIKSTCKPVSRDALPAHLLIYLFIYLFPPFSQEAYSRGTCLVAARLNPNNFSAQRKIRSCRYSLFHLLYLYHASCCRD